jgi:hypothetical protein
MQRFLELKINDKIYNTNKAIEQELYHSEFYWLLECEVDNVKIEIKDSIIYWKTGIFYWGVWHWGVFENGEFLSGDWLGGIFLNGVFKGVFKNGVFKNGTFKGKKIKGEFPNEII